MPIFEKHFTVEEATALLPELRRLVTEIQAEIETLEAGGGELPEAMEVIPTNGGGKKLEEFFKTNDRIRERLVKIYQMGVQVKDIRRGLLDFPAIREGEEVLLCWLIEEPEIVYWHDLVEGFMGRRPL
jgi:hypothetical protein